MKLFGRFILGGLLSIVVVVWGYVTIPMVLYSDAVRVEELRERDWFYLSVGLLGIVCLWALVFIWIVQPIKALVRAFKTGKNREIFREEEGRRDEIGEIVRAFIRLETEQKKCHEERVLRESAEKRAEDAAAATQRANEAKGQFLSSISHEIRTPLNNIIGFGGLLEQSEEMGKKEAEYLLHIRRSGKSLLCIIDDMLDYSRIDSGMLQLNKEVFRLMDVVDAVLEMESLKGVEKGLELDVKVHPEVPQTIYSDPERMTRVLRNLVNNAIKFTEKGSVRISIWSEREDDQSKGKTSGNLYVAVDDTGVGLDQAEIAAIFEPIAKEREQTSRPMGLGLAVSQGIAQALGGTIEAVPKSEAGARFEFSVNCLFNPEVEADMIESD